MHSFPFVRRVLALAATALLALTGLVWTQPTAQAATGVQQSARSGRPGAISRFLVQPRAARLPTGLRQTCGLPDRPGQMQCQSVVRTNITEHKGNVPNLTPGGYGPSDLQSAYSLTTAASGRGAGETVGIVDAYSDPNASTDLNLYRSQFGLPSCTTSNGCFKIVNQNGQTSPLPSTDSTGGWEAEESLDFDMVSAICPRCSILLVQAKSTSIADLGTAENTAVSMGAKFVSNSWSGSEFSGETSYDTYFNHPGAAIAFASGDSGYGSGYPASSQYVTSVGGTTLTTSNGTRTGETAWNGTGSGCSADEAKPAWQTADSNALSGCLNRTENDVAAEADPNTPVAVYDTFPQQGGPAAGWAEFGGTSAATPIIASVYALAGTPTGQVYPSSFSYLAPSSNLHDVTAGSNGTCDLTRQYLCNAETGFDGPTGLGTPNGTAAFASTSSGNTVTVIDPGTQDYEVGSLVSLQIRAVDSASSVLTYSASGLPPGLVISPLTGLITGAVTTAGTYPVTVTATDLAGASGQTTFTIVAVPSLTGAYRATSGPVILELGGKCLDDANDSSVNGNKVQIWTCLGDAAQKWQYRPGANPGGAGTLMLNGKCLDITNSGTANGSKVQLWSCTGGANQQWGIVGPGSELYNPASGRCLDDTGQSMTNGTQVDIYDCTGVSNQAWTPPPGEMLSGVAGKCMDDNLNSTANGTKIQVWNCNGTAAQNWQYLPDGTFRINGKCLDVTNRSLADGALVQLYTCATSTNANQLWTTGSNGEIVNQNSGKCLTDPADSTTSGTQLVQQTCSGRAGQIWAIT
jgi:hypothetical protein